MCCAHTHSNKAHQPTSRFLDKGSQRCGVVNLDERDHNGWIIHKDLVFTDSTLQTMEFKIVGSVCSKCKKHPEVVIQLFDLHHELPDVFSSLIRD